MGKTLSVVIPTYNCANKLKACLKSVRWANEIIIVDMFSTDETKQVAKSFGAKIFDRLPENGNFDLNRKFGMRKAKCDWILKLDMDEVLTPELQIEIKDFLRSVAIENRAGFNFPNEIFMFGKQIKHGFVKPGSHELRLFQRDKWLYNPYKFHQQIAVQGSIGDFKNSYEHHNYSSVAEFISKTNKYTDLDAREANMVTAPALGVVLAPLKTLFKLVFLQAGFLDGRVGLLTCWLFALYNLIEKVKIYEYRAN